jgi:nitrogen fixation NifU-like protein
MKIHCAQLVEGALRSALAPDSIPAPAAAAPAPSPTAPTLIESFTAAQTPEKKVRVVLKPKEG